MGKNRDEFEFQNGKGIDGVVQIKKETTMTPFALG